MMLETFELTGRLLAGTSPARLIRLQGQLGEVLPQQKSPGIRHFVEVVVRRHDLTPDAEGIEVGILRQGKEPLHAGLIPHAAHQVGRHPVATAKQHRNTVDHKVQGLRHGHAPEANGPLQRLLRAIPGQQRNLRPIQRLTAIATRPPQLRAIHLHDAAAVEAPCGCLRRSD